MNKIEFGDCLARLKEMADGSVDSVVTDPPYGLSFMGKKWDYDVPSVEVWTECLRVLKPGCHLLAFAGTRTQHRMAVRIEDAGFEIRDMIAWVYGSGFPKSLDVSKAIDKAAGAEREKVRKPCAATAYSSNAGNMRPWMERAQELGYTEVDGSEPATEAARQWQGWGTALKPALEPITVARKPLVGTVAENVLAHGTGAINVDGCRIEGAKGVPASPRRQANGGDAGGVYGRYEPPPTDTAGWDANAGRWPANLIHDGSDEVLAAFPDGAPAKAGRTAKRGGSNWHGRDGLGTPDAIGTWPADPGGSAARFFYCAKASKSDRGAGNNHPTVKPTDLMRYLCRLVTPPGGVVLDPFMGSGSTGVAAQLEGFQFVGVERDPVYFDIARKRLGLPDELY